jgi:hypothetical protein
LIEDGDTVKIAGQVLLDMKEQKKKKEFVSVADQQRPSLVSKKRSIPNTFKCMTQDLCFFKSRAEGGHAKGVRCCSEWQTMKSCRYIYKNWRKRNAEPNDPV